MGQIIFHTQDSVGMRFAYSPLLELTISYFMLGRDQNRSLYGQWMEEARIACQGQSYPLMDSLILDMDVGNVETRERQTYIPDFLTPAPKQAISSIEQAIENLRATDTALIQRDMQQLIWSKGETDLRCYFLAHPHEALEALITELTDYWERALAHHWSAMVSVLENDILQRSRTLTLEGIAVTLPAINEQFSYQDGAIVFELSKPKLKHVVGAYSRKAPVQLKEEAEKTLELWSEAVRFVPVIFAGHRLFHQVTDVEDPMIIYKPFGSGLWHYEEHDPEEALITTVGAGKARLLMALGTPQSTGELARALSLTAGAVSQQLGKLSSAGLVASHRSGKRVYYRLTARGMQLVALFS
ncbi:MAG: helix-turn-helix domain-containing protein [Chloroflexota bacterium]